MSPEKYTQERTPAVEQASNTNPDQRENPGTWRSGQRADRPRPRLPEDTRAFVQHAFAQRVVERIDEQKRAEGPERWKQWEREKWLLVRYLTDDDFSFKDAMPYVSLKTTAGVGHLYQRALKTLWGNADPDIQRRYPQETIMHAKRQFSQEHRAKLGAPHIGKSFSYSHSDETKRMLSLTHTGKKLTAETKTKIGKKVSKKLTGVTRSEETKAKIKAKIKAVRTGTIQPPETKEKIRASVREYWRKKREDKLLAETRTRLAGLGTDE